MIINNQDISALPLMAMNEIPVPKADAKEIVALVKESGKVTGYKLSNGNEYLKSIPDGIEKNNLSNLPSISM